LLDLLAQFVHVNIALAYDPLSSIDLVGNRFIVVAERSDPQV
jgi:hypothetical protein